MAAAQPPANCAEQAFNEAERLAALDRYGILDTGREAAFDDIAELAADILDAPIAVVNFIAADRQWFKAEKGIGKDSLPLDVSICRHAILQPGVFVVPDLTKDVRFEDNPLVAAADGLRFYAGSLLETPDGLPLGTLCVLDTKERPEGISARQEHALRALAVQTMAQLELRRSNATSREESERLSAMFTQATVGMSEIDLDGRFLIVNDRLCEILDQPRDKVLTLTLADVTHPDDIAEYLPKFQGMAQAGESFSLDKRYVRPDGTVIWANTSVVRLLDGQGRPRAAFAVTADITSRVEEERNRTFLLHLGDAVRSVADPNAIVEATTRALGERLGATRVAYAEIDEEANRATARGDWSDGKAAHLPGEICLSDYGEKLIARLRSGGTLRVDDTLLDPHTADSAAALETISARAIVSVPLFKDDRFVVNLNVHQSAPRIWTDAEVELIQAVAARTWETVERARAEEALRASQARLAFLDRLGAETAALAHADAVLATTTRLLGEHLNLSVCAYADMDEDEDGFTIRGDWAAPGSTSIVGHYSLADFGKLAVKNLSAGLPLVVNDNLEELAPEEAATFQSIGITATICMPLVKEGRLTALMAIHDRVARVWTEAELSLLREVTARSWAHVERVGAVAALVEIGERLQLAVDNAEVGFWDVDLVNKVLIWPTRTKALFGISADVPVTMQDFYDGLHPDDQAATAEAFAAAADPACRALYDVEYRTIGKEDGVVRWVAAKGRGLFDAGRCLRVAGTAIDITARKAAEERLRELNETLESRVTEALAERRVLADVIDGTDIFVQVADREYNWLAINKAAAEEFARIFGVPRPKVGDNMLEILKDRPDDRAAVKAVWSRALAGEEFVEVDEFGDSALDRRYYEMRFRLLRDAEGQAVGAYQFVSDVTERLHEQARLREAEEALRQSQKMEAMGQLTGGVAHDFNNLLTPIVGSLDMLQRRGVGGEREQRLIAGAAQSAERAKTLVQRLLAFSRRQPLQPVSVDVAKLVSGMADLVSSTTGPQINVVVDAPEDLPSAKADPNQLEMAVLNLAVNARDAMPNGGTLRITAGAERVESLSTPGLKPGTYVKLTVADTGVGMDEATLARAIEPFFSTKGVGKGTGLGLSMVHGLSSQLGGTLTIRSRPGLGTNIELWLPVCDAPAETAGAVAQAAQPVAAAGTALLVDDEELVRMSTADMLNDLGYAVVEAGSAEEALRLMRGGLRPELLVTDHLMRGIL